MTAAHTLTLFGTPMLRLGHDTIVFGTERPHQLLAYLGCRGTWVSRDELAEWLWPDRDQAVARSNLRKTLLLARRMVTGRVIEQSGDRLRWSPGTDLEAFDSACDERRFEEALALARAPLLLGMETALSVSATHWLAFERERIDARWRRACEQRLEELVAQPRDCRDLAERMLTRDPLDEFAVKALANALLRLGQKDQAIQAIEGHSRRLVLELGLEPSASLQAFSNEVRNGQSNPARARETGALASVMQARKNFVGRRIEGAQIASLLIQESCRVLTVTGPPGIGKSALARSVLPELATAFADGTARVALEDLTDGSQVANRIASMLELAPGGDGPVWQQLGQALGERAMLLLLDNAEHLNLARPIAELLSLCPRVRLLVTSRTRVAVENEWLLPLDGLPLPDTDETDVDILRNCDAVQLFETRALQRAPGFDLSAAASDVVRLVHLVEGLPLAIELAAAWTRVIGVGNIVSELSSSLDLLASDAEGSGERSLVASFDQSWRRLTPIEQTALTSLALIPGVFTRDLARQVAGATLPVIAALVDKSLVRSERDGRFSMHALLRQCAAVHADDASGVMARHARAIDQWLDRFRGMAQMPLAEIEAELPHLRAAFKWAVDHRAAELVVSMSPMLDRFYQQRGLWSEGASLFSSAVAAFDQAPGVSERPLLSALRPLASFRFCAGDLVEAEALSRRSLKIAQRLRDGESIKSALNSVGIALCQQGKYVQARSFFEQAQRRARVDSDKLALANLSGNLAITDEALGRYESALDQYRLAANLHRELGRVSGLTSNLNNLANLLRILQRSSEMLAPLHEALDLCTAHGLDATLSFVLVTLGLAHDDLGESEKAKVWFDRALIASRSRGEPNAEASALLGQARVDVAAARYDAAWEKAREALAIGQRLRSPRLQIDCVLGLGEILVKEGQLEQGAAVIQWSLSQPELMQADADAAKRRAAGFLPGGISAAAGDLLTNGSTIHDALALASFVKSLHGRLSTS